MLVRPLHNHMALTASRMKFSATPLLRPFPAPSNIISIKIPQATDKPVRKVRILFFLMVANISCHLSMSNIAVSSFKFRVQSFEFKVSGSKFRVQSSVAAYCDCPLRLQTSSGNLQLFFVLVFPLFELAVFNDF